MFKEIFLFEFKSCLKNISTYVFFLIFLAIAFASFAGNAGFFDPHSTSLKTMSFANSPHEINFIIQYFNKLYLFLLPAIIGASIYKDYKDNVHSILYSFPIQKRDYFFGKFTSSFCIVILISLAGAIGMIAAEFLPDLDPKKMGEFSLGGYLQVYLVYVIPNLFFYGAIVFAVVSRFRNIYAGFMSIVFIFLFQSISQNAFGSNGTLIALFDPLAQNTVSYITRFWTLEEKNNLIIPFSGLVLYNRLLWLGISGFIFAWAYKKFSFSENISALFNNPFKQIKSGQQEPISLKTKASETAIPVLNYDFSFTQQLKNIWNLSNFHFSYIIKNPMFLMFLILGLITVVFIVGKVTNTGDITLMPVTRIMLKVPAFFFSGTIVILTFLYSGMLIQRERTSGMDQLVDASAVKNWTSLFSKVLAIVKMQLVLLTVMMLAGIIIQIYNGYYQFEIGLYITQLFGLSLISLIIWAFAACLIHTIVPNLYIALFTLLMGWIGIGALPKLGIRTKLLRFNSPPDLEYSDLNGFANTLKPYLLVESYWLIFGFLCLSLAYLFWMRGVPNSIKERVSLAKMRFTKPVKLIVAMCIFSFIALGFNIYKGEKQLLFSSKKIMNKAFAGFEEQYGRYKNFNQPRICSAKINLDFYPQSNSFKANGNYTLVNKSEQKIDTLLIKTGFDEITDFNINRKSSLLSRDSLVQFSVIALEESFVPGDSMQLNFTIENKENSLFERNSNVLGNGTFLQQDILPRLGYFMTDPFNPSDPNSKKNHNFATDSDNLDFDITISTSEDQIALAPGKVINQWSENNRNYYNYKIENMKFSMGFNSLKSQVATENWNDIALEVHHHKGHDHNVNKMLDGLKGALEYNSRHFGPYQHENARIIEFPESEGTFATTYGNCIPTSEVRFIANSKTEEGEVDLSLYVSAHELTHQWWGNQIVPANALGASMLTESITEYISLRIYEETYGKEKADQFLKLQRKRYLKGRTSEQEKEPPLMLVKQEQMYISYGKGAMIFTALSKQLGEEKLNRILRGFLEQYKFQGPPYPTSLDLTETLYKEVPDSLSYLISDMFETVCLYENKINKADLRSLGEEKYEVTLDFEITKSKDGEDATLADYIEIAFFNEAGKIIESKKHMIYSKANTFKIQVDEKPAKILIDPNLLIIEVDIEDNVWEF